MADSLLITLFVFLCGVLAGIALVAAGLWYILSFFFYDRDAKCEKEKPNQHSSSATFQLPPVLLGMISDESCKSKESCWALNFILYFLFRELRNSDGVRRWILRKLSLEFEELLASSVLGKFFSSIMIQNIDVGHNFPVVNWLRTSRIELHPIFKSISKLEILVDLVYSGGFQFAIQAETHLKHSASLSVQINAVKGQALLQFATEPYAHWSFSFSENPDIDISVVSQLDGRSFSQITAIISAQLKRSVRKKHTVPMFKIRYKPFFNRIQHFVASLEPGLAPKIDTTGNLTMTLVECRGLMQNIIHGNIYANIGIGDFDWIAVYGSDSTRNVYLVRDVVYIKTDKREGNLDFTLVQHGDIPVVETVNPCVPSISQAILSTIRVCGTFSNSDLELEPGDEIIAVDGKKVSTVKQCIKNFRNCSSIKVVWRVRRSYSTRMNEDIGLEASNQGIRNRGNSIGDVNDSHVHVPPMMEKLSMPRKESGNSASTTSSRKNSCGTSAIESVTDIIENDIGSTDKPSVSLNFRLSSVENRFQQIKRTKDIPSCKDPIFEEPFDLAVENSHRFVNITLWSTRQGSTESSTNSSPSSSPMKRSKGSHAATESSMPFGHESLLGYLSVPLIDIVSDCSTTGMGYFTKDFYLCSPDGNATEAKDHALKGYSGFEPEMCYGVITLSFLFKSIEAASNRKGSVDSMAGAAVGTSNETGVAMESERNHSPSEDIRSHQFLRTHFRNAVSCDYCNKKIWLKDAYTCRACGMKCHKKCNERCIVNTICRGENYSELPKFTIGHPAPEIVTTESEPIREIDDDQSSTGSHEGDKTLQPSTSSMTVRRRTLGGLIVSAVQNRSGHLKRTGSATTLLAPASSPTNLSKSLPPSPQVSPTMSRKMAAMNTSGSENNLSSLGNPFKIIQADALGSTEESLQFNAAIEHLITHPNDNLVALAKETGRDVFHGFSLADKKFKLNYVLNRLQSEIDSATNERLAYEKEDMLPSASRFVAGSKISQCEERVQALALLMLHYCAGLQHIQELEEQQHEFEEIVDSLVEYSYDEENCQDDKISDTCSVDSNME